jgi:hypothetical protein
MPTLTAQLPLALRLFNRGFAGLGGLGQGLISLQPDALMRKACKQTGLSDYGSDYFHGPLQRLCDSLEQDAHLTGLGRAIARQDLLRLLGNRLQFVDIFKQHPKIADEVIEAPLFILGMPRTGTTSMHELMSLDPQFRVPLSWEVAQPFPPPETATYKTDPRIASVNKTLAGIDGLLPGFKDMHPMGAELPQECVALFSHDFVSMIFDVQFRLNSYQSWLIQEDMTEVFKNHRRWLQLLQWKCPGQTWVLKSPQYLWNIEDMLREYPDARAIQTHRDPIKVAMSIGSLAATLRSLGSNHIDLKEATQSYADLLNYGTQKTMAARDQGLMKPERIIDMPFSQFRQDPVAAMAAIYAYFGFELTESVAQRMHDFLNTGANNERHGKHQYTLEESGLDIARERQRFARYEQSYNIAQESF